MIHNYQPKTSSEGIGMNHHAAVLAEMEAALWKAVEILGTEFVARAVCANTWPRKVPVTQ